MVSKPVSVKCIILVRYPKGDQRDEWRKSLGFGGAGGVGGVVGGFGGYGHMGEARACYTTMAKVMRRLAEIRDNVGPDSINVEKHVE